MTRLERVKLIGHNQASIPIGKSRIKAVNRTPGAIGYVEYGDALRNKASTVQLKVGEVFVSPSFELLTLSSSDFRWRGGSYYPVKTGEGLSESQSQFQPQ